MTNFRRTLRRLLIPLAATLVAGTWVAAGAASPALASDHRDGGCVAFAPGHYDATFDFTFKVDLTHFVATAAVRVHDDAKLCGDVPITLVSYVKPVNAFGDQWKYDSLTKVLNGATKHAEFSVSVPHCAGQADLFFGSQVHSPLNTNNLYGNLILGDSKAPGANAHGAARAGEQFGSKECVVNPGATWTDTCNQVTGTFQNTPATLPTTITVFKNGVKAASFPIGGDAKNLVQSWDAKDGDTFSATYRDKTGAEKPFGDKHVYKKPDNCTLPPPPAGGGGSTPTGTASGSLPTTGASVLLLVGAGVLLIGGGGAAMYLTRRRKSGTEES